MLHLERADELRHEVHRYAVACGPVLAVELHRVGGSGRTLVCFVPGGTTDPQRKRPVTSAWEHQQLRELELLGCDGLTLNFAGVGRSSGELIDNTLARRGRWIGEVLEAVAPRGWRGPLVLVGCSMGAHVAALLARQVSACALVLVAPAAYGPAAQELPFSPQFRDVIRRPLSWRCSPAFAAVSRFPGEVLLLLPERDAVIPAEVTRLYQVAAGATASVWLPGASHRMLSSSRPEDHRARGLVCAQIAGVASRAQQSRPG